MLPDDKHYQKDEHGKDASKNKHENSLNPASAGEMNTYLFIDDKGPKMAFSKIHTNHGLEAHVAVM